MTERFGATPEAWEQYLALGLTADLLPVVSNPHATISGGSKMKGLGKTPSWYNQRREVAGIAKWTEHQTTAAEVRRWMLEPDYGICVQTRRIRAIDIDVADLARSATLVAAVQRCMGCAAPMRYRFGTGKVLIPFEYAGDMPKRVIPVEGGIVEFLGDGQQFVAEGTHPEGERYEWQGSIAEVLPFDEERLEELWQSLVMLFATGEPRIARQKRIGKGAVDLVKHDHVADWLNDNWELYDVGPDGQLYIECPFSEEHSTESGPTSTAYFIAGTGGYEQGHFVCLHAHCAGRDDVQFLDAIGYNLAQFEDLGAVEDQVVAGGSADTRGLATNDDGGTGSIEPPSVAERAGLIPWPTFTRDKAGRIEATADNITKAVGRCDIIFRHLAYDRFKDELVWAPNSQSFEDAQWRPFGDADMIAVRIELERRGFKPMGKELLRDAIYSVAVDRAIDTAQVWLSRLQWDGVSRVATFAADCWGWEPGAYASAVSRYVWTALAGRVLEPGVRADMAPILVGEQGLKKTSSLQAMAPDEEHYVEIKLNENDDNLSRKLRGKLIGELEELRGLNSRAIDEIKAFISRRFESWVPKFKEFENRFWRRLIMFGSTNDDEFLNDPTGERRWLPGRCAFIDLDRIKATRDQLWAEGAFLFELSGVDWQDAERLAPIEHRTFKISDAWEYAVKIWLAHAGVDQKTPEERGPVLVAETLVGALGIMPAQQNRTMELRVMKVLQHLGFKRVPVESGWGFTR